MSKCTYRLKHLARLNVRSLQEDEPEDLEFRYIDISTVGRGRLVAEPQRTRFEDAPSRARRLVTRGDTIISTVRTYLGAVWPVAEPAHDLVVSTGFTVVSPGPELDPRFFGWWAQSNACIDGVVARSVGVSYPAVNASDIGDLRIDLPDRARQREIALFLDAETGRIDALIEKRQQMIALLKTRRASVMYAGVSGRSSDYDRCWARVPWLDDRPVHWDEAKLTHVARLGSGHTPSRDHPEWWEDCTIPWVTTGEVAQMRADRIEFITETRENVSELGIANSSAAIHPSGTVVLCRTAASAGYSAILGAPMATSQDFATWTCGPQLRPRFLLLCLRVMRRDLLERLAMGSTHRTIYMPDIESIRVPLPPLKEQDRIVDATWRQLRAIDAAMDAVARQIDRLRERHQALITAAVTGNLDVASDAA